MKFLSNVLLIYLAVPVWLSGIANAQTINIYDEYKAGRRIIKEIITPPPSNVGISAILGLEL